MAQDQIRLLVICAHPDDAEISAGGLAAIYRQLGHHVRFVSVTNGAAGHHKMYGEELVQRRYLEAQAAGAVIGAEYEVWNYPDGELQPTLEVRRRIIRLIRQYRPDLVLTHRMNDYHPDHRYTSQLVQDAAYMLTVPAICADVPPLKSDPVIMYPHDTFTKPVPFAPSILVAIDEVFEQKVRMVESHESQIFEWLPYNGHFDFDNTTSRKQQQEVVRNWLIQRATLPSCAEKLFTSLYGENQSNNLKLFETFELCEYGATLDAQTFALLFPFLPDLYLSNTQ